MEEDAFEDNPYHTPPAQREYKAKLVFDAWVLKLTYPEARKGRCLDCERQEHLAKLNEIFGESFDASDMRKLRDAVMWILENTDYPVGE